VAPAQLLDVLLQTLQRDALQPGVEGAAQRGGRRLAAGSAPSRRRA
jgi:hypothetical protein